MALGVARDAQRQRDAALETLSDREMTITKFRELTQKLQEQCLELQNRLQSSESTNTAVKGEIKIEIFELVAQSIAQFSPYCFDAV